MRTWLLVSMLFVGISASTSGPVVAQTTAPALPAEDPAPSQSQIGVYYLGGYVSRTGVYDLKGREVTLRQAIAAAGGIEDGAAIARITRYTPDEQSKRQMLRLQNELEALDAQIIGLTSQYGQAHVRVQVAKEQRATLQKELDRASKGSVSYQNIDLKALLAGTMKDVVLRPNDEITIGTVRPAATQPAP